MVWEVWASTAPWSQGKKRNPEARWCDGSSQRVAHRADGRRNGLAAAAGGQEPGSGHGLRRGSSGHGESFSHWHGKEVQSRPA